MKSEPNAYDAAFAAAMLGHRMADCQMNTMTRVALAGCAIAEVEAEGLIAEGDYELLVDLIRLNLLNSEWPGRPVTISQGVREILKTLEVSHA